MGNCRNILTHVMKLSHVMIPTEMFLALEGIGIDLLFNLITKIYETGTFHPICLSLFLFPCQRPQDP